MLTAIKENVEVLDGGILQLHSSNLKPHTMVSVSAILETKEPSLINLSEMIGTRKGLLEPTKDGNITIQNKNSIKSLSDNKKIDEIFNKIAKNGGLDIDDPIAWQKELRNDKNLYL